MPKPEREKIEYEFEDLRRNTDPVPGLVLAQLGFDTDGEADERQEGKKRRDAATKRKDDGEDDGSRDHDERDAVDDEDLDDDEDVTLSRKELARQLTQTRRQVERKARQDIDEAKGEAADVIGKLEKRLDGIERKGESSTIDAEFTPKIAALETQLEEAMEKGETKTVMALNRQIADLTADRKIQLHDAKNRRSVEDEDEQRSKVKPVPRRVQRWIDKQDWFDDPEQAHVKAYLHKVDRDLLADGLDSGEDEYWAKLEKRIEKSFPGVLTLTQRGKSTKDDDDDEDDDDVRSRRRGKNRDDDEDEDDDRDSRRDKQRGAARRSPVSDGGQGGVARERDREDGSRRRNGEVRLNKGHLANMRAFGLDPDNKKHVEEYTLEVARQHRDRR